jgi:hypothetical protein
MKVTDGMAGGRGRKKVKGKRKPTTKEELGEVKPIQKVSLSSSSTSSP